MFGSNILEVVIGLVFIYLLYSILATTIKEGIASLLGLRAKMLEKAIKRMLDDGLNEPDTFWAWIWSKVKKVGEVIYRITLYIVPLKKIEKKEGTLLVHKFYGHPGIKYLAENRLYKRPSYISPECFSKTVVDVLKELGTDAQVTTQTNSQKLALGISKINELDETKQLILSFYEEADRDLDKFKTSLEQWFNETMDRATGWYKKQAQKIILVIGFVLALIFNIDTISIVKKLSKDKDARKELADLASSSYKTLLEKKNTDSVSAAELEIIRKYNYADSLIKDDINNANSILGLGWEIPECNSCIAAKDLKNYKQLINYCCYSLKKIKTSCPSYSKSNCHKASYVLRSAFGSGRKLLGYLITAIAISFGAPFWFDLLSKLMQIRGSGKKPEEDKTKQPVVK